MIHVRDLRKSFGSRAVLNGLDLEVAPGSVTLLVGANGAGKTTTLRLIAGLSASDTGTITIAGHDLRRERSAALAHLSFLPQSPRFHPRLTVQQTAEFYAEMRGRLSSVSVALDLWGLCEFARMPTGKLSGGLRQRLALALVTLADTPVLLLDEPGLSLDPEWRQHLQDFLRAEAARGHTVLIATHLLGEWDGRTDRCILVEAGRARCDLPPDEIRDRFPMAAGTLPNGLQSSVALRASAGTDSPSHANPSRSFRSGLHSELVAPRACRAEAQHRRISAGAIAPGGCKDSRSSRGGLHAGPRV